MANINRIRQQNIMDGFGSNFDINSQDMFAQSSSPQQSVMPEWRIPRAEFVHPFPNQPSVDWIARMNQLYTPETEMTDFNNKLVKSFPERKKPGIANKFAASMMGLSGKSVKDMDAVLQGGNDRRIEDWKTRTGPSYNAANLERQGNINERQLAGQIVTAEANDRRISETERKNQATEAENRRKNEAREGIDRQKVEISRAKAMGAKFHTAGENVIATFPDGKVVDTGIKTTNFSPFELENLRQDGRLELENQRSKNDRTEIIIRGEQQRETNRVNPRNTDTPDADTPNEARVRRNNTFQQVWDSRPELRKFLKQPSSVNGNWSLGDPPSAGWLSGVDPKDKALYEEAQKLTAPNLAKPTTKPTNTPANTQQPRIQRNKATGAMRISTDGGKTWKPYNGGQ